MYMSVGIGWRGGDGQATSHKIERGGTEKREMCCGALREREERRWVSEEKRR